MAVSPSTKEIKDDPVVFKDGKFFITILPYYGGFVAYLPDPQRGLCGKDLRGYGVALIEAAVQVDSLNRDYEAGRINNTDFVGRHIPIEAL